jgi:transaldolase/glucose-6-phosphate isomerase
MSEQSFLQNNPLWKLESLGQSLWMDFLRRGMLTSGEMERYIAEDGVTGVTSNPAIFERSIAGSRDYDEAIRTLALEGRSVPEILERLTVDDVRAAADSLRGVYDKTEGRDGFVSLEVSPHLARDTDGTVAEALRLWRAVDRPNLMIKVPGTREGLPAIRRLISDGINVNVTLLFGLPRYRETAEAYLAGLEDRAQGGHPLARTASVASFFLSRIDVLLDPELERIAESGGEHAAQARSLLGKIAVASAKEAYSIYREIFASERFHALAEQGARSQRLLWASTGTKNPAYSDVKYVEPLIGPETVNTMPLETITAFRDHGRAEERLAEGLDDARSALGQLERIGIDLDRITRRLEDEGVEKFIQPFDRLMETLRAAGEAALRQPVDSQTIAPGRFRARVDARIERMEKERFGSRLWKKDSTLWVPDIESGKQIRNALGWLHVAEKMSENLEELSRFVSEVKALGIRRVVHMGMGGSSMAPIVLTQILPAPADGLPVTILDSTDPAAVRGIERRNPVETTLFIVASKSGTTAEPLAFGEYFYARAVERLGQRAGGNFAAVTDPGTPLEELARKRGFRRVFRNFTDIGGRYSALSYFGLLPAALAGLNVSELIERALRMADSCAGNVRESGNPGLRLGAALGEMALEGCDKVTFLTPANLAPLGLWLEQLLAESTGKDGKGLLPVAGEPLAPPRAYGNDRCFVVFQLKSALDAELARGAEELQRAGFPVVSILLDDPCDIGQEFFRWEIAVAAAGAVLGINPFDQPNVSESKQNTNRLLDVVAQTGALPPELPSLSEPPLSLFAGEPAPTVEETLRNFLYQSEPGDYFAIQAFLAETPETDAALRKIRRRLRDRFRIATTAGYGPRFLHSTGQYHKGGPNTGLFLQLTADSPEDLPVPNAPYTFGVLERAQAIGDLRALAGHGRLVVRVHLGTDAPRGLSKLDEILEAVVRSGSPGKSSRNKPSQKKPARKKAVGKKPAAKKAVKKKVAVKKAVVKKSPAKKRSSVGTRSKSAAGRSKRGTARRPSGNAKPKSAARRKSKPAGKKPPGGGKR